MWLLDDTLRSEEMLIHTIPVTISGEVFSEYELWVNAFAPFDHTMTFTQTRDLDIYLRT